MGIFNRFRNTSADPGYTLGRADTLPATANDVAGRITAGGKDLASKATQIYKENPKLVSGIALVASALLLNRLRGSNK
ncbi:MAG: hypothetical protein ABIR98_00505 [Usitatibacter sp.]